jgi:hypothetical protein
LGLKTPSGYCWAFKVFNDINKIAKKQNDLKRCISDENIYF